MSIGRLLTALCATVLAVTVVRAQPNIVAVRSLEYKVSTADSIIVGHIASISHPGSDLAKGRMTIKVDETLKGINKTTVDLDVDPLYGDYVEGYAEDQEIMVMFPSKSDPNGPEKPIIAITGSIVDTFSTADFKFYNTSADFIREVRRIVASNPGPSQGNWIVDHQDTFEGLRWSREFEGIKKEAVIHGLMLPIDRNLRKRAIEWLRSPDWNERMNGVRALVYFKSDETIAALKPLLSDPGFDIRYADQNKGIEVHNFRIRQEVFSMLQRWGANPKRPVMEESVPRYDTIEVLYWWGIETPGELEALRKTKKLKEFHTYARSFSPVDLSALASVQTLTRIVCNQAELSDSDLKVLSKMKNLRSLDIASARVTDAAVEILASFPELRAVNLGGTHISVEGIERLRHLRPGLYIRPPQ